MYLYAPIAPKVVSSNLTAQPNLADSPGIAVLTGKPSFVLEGVGKEITFPRSNLAQAGSEKFAKVLCSARPSSLQTE